MDFAGSSDDDDRQPAVKGTKKKATTKKRPVRAASDDDDDGDNQSVGGGSDSEAVVDDEAQESSAANTDEDGAEQREVEADDDKPAKTQKKRKGGSSAGSGSSRPTKKQKKTGGAGKARGGPQYAAKDLHVGAQVCLDGKWYKIKRVPDAKHFELKGSAALASDAAAKARKEYMQHLPAMAEQIKSDIACHLFMLQRLSDADRPEDRHSVSEFRSAIYTGGFLMAPGATQWKGIESMSGFFRKQMADFMTMTNRSHGPVAKARKEVERAGGPRNDEAETAVAKMKKAVDALEALLHLNNPKQHWRGETVPMTWIPEKMEWLREQHNALIPPLRAYLAGEGPEPVRGGGGDGGDGADEKKRGAKGPMLSLSECLRDRKGRLPPSKNSKAAAVVEHAVRWRLRAWMQSQVEKRLRLQPSASAADQPIDVELEAAMADEAAAAGGGGGSSSSAASASAAASAATTTAPQPNGTPPVGSPEAPVWVNADLLKSDRLFLKSFVGRVLVEDFKCDESALAFTDDAGLHKLAEGLPSGADILSRLNIDDEQAFTLLSLMFPVELEYAIRYGFQKHFPAEAAAMHKPKAKTEKKKKQEDGEGETTGKEQEDSGDKKDEKKSKPARKRKPAAAAEAVKANGVDKNDADIAAAAKKLGHDVDTDAILSDVREQHAKRTGTTQQAPPAKAVDDDDDVDGAIEWSLEGIPVEEEKKVPEKPSVPVSAPASTKPAASKPATAAAAPAPPKAAPAPASKPKAKPPTPAPVATASPDLYDDDTKRLLEEIGNFV